MNTIVKITYIDTPVQRYVAMSNSNGYELHPVVRTVEVA